MLTHNFDKSINRERNKQKAADDFYMERFKASKILRYNTNSESDMKFQMSDIDVSIVVNEKTINISEKFRDFDYNDFFVEIYSKYPQTIGWLYNSEADFIAYFFPSRMFLVNGKSLFEAYKNIIKPVIDYNFIDCFHKKNVKRNAKQKFAINIGRKSFTCALVQAFNRIGNSSWHTIGVAVPFGMLKLLDVCCREFNI